MQSNTVVFKHNIYFAKHMTGTHMPSTIYNMLFAIDPVPAL